MDERLSWTIQDVRGRKSGDKGVATAQSMTLRRPNGSSFGVGRVDMRDRPLIGAESIARATHVDFDRCPICLVSDPTSKEHVPPKAMGGGIMTLTCVDCNNKLGSTAEADLISRWEDAPIAASFTHEALRGARKLRNVYLRQSEKGEPVVVSRGNPDPEIARVMVPGSRFELRFVMPDTNRCRLAVLKHAYLGACLLIQEIPESVEADAIRAELMAARWLSARESPSISQLAASLRFAFAQGPGVPGEVCLAQATSAAGVTWMAISLSRTLLVEWPFTGAFAGRDAEDNVLTWHPTGAAS